MGWESQICLPETADDPGKEAAALPGASCALAGEGLAIGEAVYRVVHGVPSLRAGRKSRDAEPGRHWQPAAGRA